MKTRISLAASVLPALVGAVVVFGAGDAMAQWPSYPSFPVIVTQPTITGVNAMTGGLNTGGTTINNSAFDPFRASSMRNGSMRQVNRPVRDQFGRITGWQTGVEWRNGVTGQIHGNTQIHTGNGLGGVHTQANVYSGKSSNYGHSRGARTSNSYRRFGGH